MLINHVKHTTCLYRGTLHWNIGRCLMQHLNFQDKNRSIILFMICNMHRRKNLRSIGQIFYVEHFLSKKWTVEFIWYVQGLNTTVKPAMCCRRDIVWTCALSCYFEESRITVVILLNRHQMPESVTLFWIIVELLQWGIMFGVTFIVLMIVWRRTIISYVCRNICINDKTLECYINPNLLLG